VVKLAERAKKIWIHFNNCKGKMKTLLVLLAVLPQLILSDNANNDNINNDNEKYTQNHLTPTSSLYCNDLNPQMHLDFNMVNTRFKWFLHTYAER
jgi:hypothetical protein